jgi:mannose-1-phosphate guanylyltransferase
MVGVSVAKPAHGHKPNFMMNSRYAVIMAGGRGERFWPQSRLSRPKHLLPIVGSRPMLAQTVGRLEGLVRPENILVITNEEQRAAVQEVCPEVPPGNIIAEPVGRDTAAAVGLAVLLVEQRDPAAVFAMLPADHVIHDTAAFQATLRAAFREADVPGSLITVGIEPRYAATGYGYVQRGEALPGDGPPVYKVLSFKEKPALATAQAYLESGAYFWNAGMFVWRVDSIRAAFSDLAPDLWHGLQPIREGLRGGQSVDALLQSSYPALPKISVDYAIMEKASMVRVVQSTFDWDDVGEWPALERHHPADAAGNVTRGSVCIEGGERNIALSEGGHTLALVGVDDLIVVHTRDATLVCSKERAQEIKALVKRLGEEAALRHLL